jgi:hypothetical protein
MPRPPSDVRLQRATALAVGWHAAVRDQRVVTRVRELPEQASTAAPLPAVKTRISRSSCVP